MQILRLALLTTLALASAAPGAAAAAQRYASPSGSGTACSSASPCEIAQAITGAKSGDEVVVLPGDHALTATPPLHNQVTIRGVPGQPRPRLVFSANGQGGMFAPAGTVLRHLEIVQEAPATYALFAFGASVDQVSVKSSSPPACMTQFVDSTVRNSIVVAQGAGASAICTTNGAGHFRNVTAVATGSGGVAIEAAATGASATAAVELVNVIAKGGPGGASLAMSTDSSGAAATISARHTNWANYWTSGTNAHYVDSGGNQGTSPAFAADYRQAAGSVTIGAGVDDPLNGAFDLDGDPRTVGTTDIGADEFFVAPAAVPGPGDETPTTAASPATTATPAAPAATPAFAGVTLVSRRLSFGARSITLRLSCPAATVGRCSGTTRLSARRRALGRASFSIAAGRQAEVRLSVSRAGRRLLDRVRRIRATGITAAHDGTGRSTTTAAAVTIRRRKG
ncbi:MAG TPA: hypothetical protein VFN44_03845 [Solirubrobacteraceae bacterium]|nr:hypothetical protein [Solirubrobacteraceae bacterium]